MTREERIAEILGEYFARGEKPDAHELRQAHPELADEIEAQLAALSLFDRAAGPRPELAEGIPERIGDFRILREIGRGGMGIVFEAEQTSMKRRVALKLLSLSVTGAPHAVKRFQREAQAAGRLHHTNIVPIHAMGQYAGHWYYAMEIVDGRPLSRVLEMLRAGADHPTEESLARMTPQNPVTPATGTGARSYFVRIAEMFAGVAEALHLAHSEGIVHRDVKPANLLLHADGVLKIIDFGLARTEAEGPSMTVTGDLLGTPAYMSPEQAMAKRIDVDHRTDVYSLGATLYELLTLEPPFRGRSLQDLCSRIVTKDPALPRRVNQRVPRDLETIVMKAMEKDRDRRYQSAAEFARDLRRFTEGTAIFARRIGPLGRAWRKVKRHPVRASLAAALLLAAVLAGTFAVRAARDAERARRLEYEHLLLAGEDAVARAGYVAGDSSGGAPWTERGAAAELFARAIELVPERPEAYALRALAPNRTRAERLADAESAIERGLATETGRLLVAHLGAGEPHPRTTVDETVDDLQLYLAARLAEREGDPARCRKLLDELLDRRTPGRLVAYLGHRRRAHLRAGVHDYAGAIEDALALRRMGDRSPELQIALARTWVQLDQDGRVAKCLDEATAWARARGTPGAWDRLCLLAMDVRRADWLERFATEGLAAHPDAALLLCRLGQAELLDKRSKASLASANQALALQPDLAEAYLQRAWALSALDRQTQAIKDCARYEALVPHGYRSHALRGVILLRQARHADAAAAFEHALEACGEPPDPTILQNQVLALRELGRLDEALAAADRLVALSPNWMAGHERRGLVLLGMKEYEQAAEALEFAAALAPDGVTDGLGSVYNNLSHCLFELDRHEDAVTAADRAIELRPDEGTAYSNRGWARAALYDEGSGDRAELERALADFDQAIARGCTDGHAGRANALLALGKPKEALAALEALPNLSGASRQHLLAGVLHKTGDHAGAVAAYTRALESSATDHYSIFLHRATALASLGEYKKALEDSERAARHRSSPAVHFNRGNYLSHLERHEDALDAYAACSAMAPADPRPFHGRWAVFTKLERYDDALREVKRALEVAPGYAPALRQRVWMLLWLDRIPEAAAAARAIDREEAARAWCTRANALESEGRAADARALLERGLAALPGSHTMLNHVAWSLAMDDFRETDRDARIDRAVELARTATRLQPRRWSYHDTLGVVLYYDGQLEECLRVLEKAMRLREESDPPASAWLFVAMAKHRLGHDDARAWYDRTDAWIDQHGSDDDELRRFREEARTVLGIDTVPARSR